MTVRRTGARPGTSARGLLGPAVLATLLAGAVAVLVAGLVAGVAGATGALVGAGLVLGFLLLGQVPVAQVARGRRSLGAMLLVLLYTVRVVVLLAALRALSVSDTVHRTSIGVTVIACALAWTAGTVWSALRWQPVLVEPADSSQETVHTR